MKKASVILLTLLLSANLSAQNTPTITNIDFTYDGAFVTIGYDILPAKNGQKFYIDITAIGDDGHTIQAQSFSGDVGLDPVVGAKGKKIVWDIENDNVILNESIHFQITWKPELDVATGKHIRRSLMFPGSGDYQLRNGKHYWLLGVAAYGLVASSIYMNSKANSTYSDYKKELDIDARNSYYKDYQNQLVLSSSCAGVAATIWLSDIYGIVRQSKKVQHNPTSEQSHYYYQLANTTYKAYSEPKHIDNRKPYHIALDNGDRYFKTESYAQAISSYQEALQHKPNDEIAELKLNEAKRIQQDIITTKENELAEQKRKEALYQQTIAKADSLFYASNYELAIINYRKAVTQRPTETHPKQQIEEIEAILAQQKQDDKFAQLCAEAESFLKARKYELAKQKYEDALRIKSDALVSDKIAEISEIQEKNRTDAAYQQTITLADQNFRNGVYSDALQNYQKAINLKPTASYPKQQINKIEAILKEHRTIKIPLEARGNSKIIKAKLNGIMEFDFIVDTGADNVLVSSDIFRTFYKGGIIKDEDLIDMETYTVADGSSIIGLSFYLRKIEFGDITLTDVKASVIDSDNIDCLMGGSAFKKLGQITIDYDNDLLIIEKK